MEIEIGIRVGAYTEMGFCVFRGIKYTLSKYKYIKKYSRIEV